MSLDKLLARRWPDLLLVMAVRVTLKRKTRNQVVRDVEARRAYKTDFVKRLKQQKIAIHTDDANVQHYELSPEFFKAVLGKMLKYSCGYWPWPVDIKRAHLKLDQSEEEMLKLACRRADVADGQQVLDLGCGCGSAALYMAREYTGAEITAASNFVPLLQDQPNCSMDQMNKRSMDRLNLGSMYPSQVVDRV